MLMRLLVVAGGTISVLVVTFFLTALLENNGLILLMAGSGSALFFYQFPLPEKPAADDRSKAQASVRQMLPKMTAALSEYFNCEVNVISTKDTGAAIEIRLLIGDATQSQEQLVIVPYHRAGDAEYWKEVTKIAITNLSSAV